jgi:SAM-dependent methyltransferase
VRVVSSTDIAESPTPTRTDAGVAIETVTHCDLCGGTNFRERKRWRDYHMFGPDMWTLVECADCSLHFINPRPTREAMGAFYEADYAAHTAPLRLPKKWHRRVSSRNAAPVRWWERPLLQIRQDVSWYRFPTWTGEGHVLDVGCGSGGRYLDLLKAIGWTTYGVEPSKHAVEAAIAKGHRATVGTAEEQHFPDESMDLVTIWHVLEHTHSPRQALTSIYRSLRPGGQLSLCVPNWGSWQAAAYGRFWWSCDAPRHLHQFSWRTLRRYLEDVGFRIVRKSTRTGSTSWQRAWRHMGNAIFGTRWSHDSTFLMDALEPFVILLSMVRFFGVGGEIRVIAERPA